MALSEEQKHYLNHLCDTLSINALVELKKGNIEGIKDFNTKLIDPNLIAEHEEMKEILKECINRRNRNQQQ
jgi:hypothetical protein